MLGDGVDFGHENAGEVGRQLPPEPTVHRLGDGLLVSRATVARDVRHRGRGSLDARVEPRLGIHQRDVGQGSGDKRMAFRRAGVGSGSPSHSTPQ